MDQWQAGDWSNHDMLTVFVGVLLGIFLFSGIRYALSGRGSKSILSTGEIDMLRRSREEEVERIMAQCMCDAIEEAWLNGHLSREEASFWERRLANLFDLKDLLPRGKMTLKRQLYLKHKYKQEARERIALLKSTPPAPLPDVTTAPVVQETKIHPFRMKLEEIIRKHLKTEPKTERVTL